MSKAAASKPAAAPATPAALASKPVASPPPSTVPVSVNYLKTETLTPSAAQLGDAGELEDEIFKRAGVVKANSFIVFLQAGESKYLTQVSLDKLVKDGKPFPKFYVHHKAATKEFLDAMIADVKLRTPESLTEAPDQVRIGTWNLGHFNDRTADHALQLIAEIMANYDIIMLVEVSKTAQFQALKKFLPAGFDFLQVFEADGAVVFNKSRVTVDKHHGVWDGNIKHKPFHVGFTFGGMSFVVVEVHLMSGQDSEQRLAHFRRLPGLIKSITDFSKALKTSVPVIVAGDFNADITYPNVAIEFKKFVDSNEKPYKALFKTPTMIAMPTNSRVNDNIFLPPDLILDGEGVLHRFNLDLVMGNTGDMQLLPRHALQSLLSGLYTDHCMLGCVIKTQGLANKPPAKFFEELKKNSKEFKDPVGSKRKKPS